MKKSLLALVALLGTLATANAATVTLPSVTFTGPASTSIACAQTGASLAVPVAAGTVIFSCTVSPAGWTGVVTSNLAAPFAVSGLSGNTFNIVVSTAVVAAGTVAPGSVSTAP